MKICINLISGGKPGRAQKSMPTPADKTVKAVTPLPGDKFGDSGGVFFVFRKNFGPVSRVQKAAPSHLLCCEGLKFFTFHGFLQSMGQSVSDFLRGTPRGKNAVMQNQGIFQPRSAA